MRKFSLCCASELMAAYTKRQGVLARGLVITDDYITLLWCRPKYDIALDRLETPTQLLGWVHHLADKNWMDLQRMQYFVEQISRMRGWDIHQ